MELVTPDLGLAIWTTLAFIILLVLLKAFAWKPILGAIKEREESIEVALKSADEAKAEMQKLQASNENLLKEAREEREAMIKIARETRDKMVNDAKSKAKDEADLIIANAKAAIQNEKNAAMAEIKSQVAELSIEIAEKVIRAELKEDKKQKGLVDQLVSDIKLN